MKSIWKSICACGALFVALVWGFNNCGTPSMVGPGDVQASEEHLFADNILLLSKTDESVDISLYVRQHFSLAQTQQIKFVPPNTQVLEIQGPSGQDAFGRSGTTSKALSEVWVQPQALGMAKLQFYMDSLAPTPSNYKTFYIVVVEEQTEADQNGSLKGPRYIMPGAVALYRWVENNSEAAQDAEEQVDTLPEIQLVLGEEENISSKIWSLRNLTKHQQSSGGAGQIWLSPTKLVLAQATEDQPAVEQPPMELHWYEVERETTEPNAGEAEAGSGEDTEAETQEPKKLIIEVLSDLKQLFKPLEFSDSYTQACSLTDLNANEGKKIKLQWPCPNKHYGLGCGSRDVTEVQALAEGEEFPYSPLPIVSFVLERCEAPAGENTEPSPCQVLAEPATDSENPTDEVSKPWQLLAHTRGILDVQGGSRLHYEYEYTPEESTSYHFRLKAKTYLQDLDACTF